MSMWLTANGRRRDEAESRKTAAYEMPAGGGRYLARELPTKQKRLAKTTPAPAETTGSVMTFRETLPRISGVVT
jgi:hypothetical protein